MRGALHPDRNKNKAFQKRGYSGVRRGQFAGYEGPEEDAARLAFSVELLQEIHPNKAVEGMFFYRFLRKGQGREACHCHARPPTLEPCALATEGKSSRAHVKI